MTAKIEFFPVDNGDMVLLTLESGKYVLIDVNVRKAADDEEDDGTPDVIAMLKERLPTDAEGCPFVDAFLLSHPDADHCRGLERHFHLGEPSDYPKDSGKIFVREMWSSPIIFRRQSDLEGELCSDAEAWWKEARRRVAVFRADKTKVGDGDRILVLGEDRDGKTDDLGDIRVDVKGTISKICGKTDGTFSGLLLAPMPAADEAEEEILEKNHSSVVVRFVLKGGDNEDACRFLTGGDAGVAIWERLWERHKDTADDLSYDVLLTPHHCSWRSLSYDSWSDKGEDAVVCDDARSALSETRNGAILIASSKEIKDDDDDPPCIRAKREYEEIAGDASGEFLCVADTKGEVLVIEINADGPSKGTTAKTVTAAYVLTDKSAPPPKAEKRGGGRYA